jgi:glycosyltransferase
LRISVVTAVRNRRATVAEAVESVARQTHSEVEHLVQDGASTDGTLEILRAVAGPDVRIESVPDGGLYHAINRGLARATGDVVGLMHSDDLYASDRVLARVAEAFADPGTDGVYGDLDYVSARDVSRVIRRWRSGPYAPQRLARGWMPPHPTLYLRREVLERWGAYDTTFRIAADYEAMLRWLVRGNLRLTYVPEVFVRMRVGGESNRSLGRILLKSREDLAAMRRHGVGGVGTLARKNLSKLEQFVRKDPETP